MLPRLCVRKCVILIYREAQPFLGFSPFGSPAYKKKKLGAIFFIYRGSFLQVNQTTKIFQHQFHCVAHQRITAFRHPFSCFCCLMFCFKDPTEQICKYLLLKMYVLVFIKCFQANDSEATRAQSLIFESLLKRLMWNWVLVFFICCIIIGTFINLIFFIFFFYILFSRQHLVKMLLFLQSLCRFYYNNS